MSEQHLNLPVDESASTPSESGRSTLNLWRSLEQRIDAPEYRQFLEAEFPQAVSVFSSVDRRQFLQLMGASLALAGLSACTNQPDENIVPYVRAPENIVPGQPLYFATAMPLAGDAVGLLVESHMGRPTKIEGNPDHPNSLGATDAQIQGSILGLYDPDRSRVVRNAGEIRPWSAFVDSVKEVVEKHRAGGGAGLRILSGAVSSPTLAAQVSELLTALPQARWHRWEPVNDDNVTAGTRLAFGSALSPQYHISKAKVIVSLDADFVASGPQHLRHARELAARRRAAGQFARLYVAEPTPSLTGSKADHRLPVSFAGVRALAAALAARVGAGNAQAGAPTGAELAWVEAVAKDLAANRGASLVIAGAAQPPAVHALAHAINQALGNAGTTVSYLPVADEQPAQIDSLRELVSDMNAGRVDALFIVGCNPVYTAPADLKFAEALEKVAYRAHLGLYDDETAVHCHWHVPEAHYLESWSDTRAQDGTLTIIQPLIVPLYGGKNAHELLAALNGQGEATSYELVRRHWRSERSALSDAEFDLEWRRWLHSGVVSQATLEVASVSLAPNWASSSEAALAPAPADGCEVVFRADAHVFDGRFANNGWLQELPKPLTKIVWENALLVGPQAAERWGVASGDIVELEVEGRKVSAPIWILPGQAGNTVTVSFGYGRERGGELAKGRGFDAYAVRSSGQLWRAVGSLRKTGSHQRLVTTQDHSSMEGRELIRVLDINGHQEIEHEEHESLYPPYNYDGYKWGMTIDLAACIGCNACTIACQAENNIPVVGKDQVSNGREMHWIRVDRYFEGEPEDPAIYHQPVPCMHCENAPCEPVCPVNATTHSSEGLNEMVYNRCVGTRYCANNCPYKVRRFNFHLYNDWNTESLKLQRNPDVTVRSRGVMEKCSFCVQRINAGRIEAKKEGRSLRDGEVITACQQVCPTEAIVFGDLNDPNSRVAKLKKQPRNYGILTELNTHPRTTYLAELRDLGSSKGKA